MKKYNSFADFIDHVAKIKEENINLRKRVDDLETVLIECKALLINIEDVKIDNIHFIMSEIDRVIKE